MSTPGKLPSHLEEIIASKQAYPIGTLAYYGPDDQTCTKIVASVINAPNARPQFRQWEDMDICDDPHAVAEIGAFFRLNGVQDVVMTDGVIGCPHEEGLDYAEGTQCPHCPFWLDRNGV